MTSHFASVWRFFSLSFPVCLFIRVYACFRRFCSVVYASSVFSTRVRHDIRSEPGRFKFLRCWFRTQRKTASDRDEAVVTVKWICLTTIDKHLEEKRQRSEGFVRSFSLPPIECIDVEECPSSIDRWINGCLSRVSIRKVNCISKSSSSVNHLNDNKNFSLDKDLSTIHHYHFNWKYIVERCVWSVDHKVNLVPSFCCSVHAHLDISSSQRNPYIQWSMSGRDRSSKKIRLIDWI